MSFDIDINGLKRTVADVHCTVAERQRAFSYLKTIADGINLFLINNSSVMKMESTEQNKQILHD